MKRILPLALSTLILAGLAVVALAATGPIPIEARLAGSGHRSPSDAVLELVPLTLINGDAPLSTSSIGLRVSAPEPGFWRVIARIQGSASAMFDLVPLVEPMVLPELRPLPARRIEVRVTTLADRPLAGAAVRLEAVAGRNTDAPAWGPAPVVSATAEDGYARLEVTPETPLLLTVSAPNFVTARREIGPEDLGKIAVRLALGDTRSLEVKDEQGRPVPAVTVTTSVGLLLGTTDGNGRLAVTSSREEDTELRLLAAGCRWAQGTLRRDSPADLAFLLELPRTLRGRAVDHQTREPIPGAWIWAEGYLPCSARTDSNGQYSLPLPGFGEARLRATAAGHLPETLTFRPTPTAKLWEAPVLALAPSRERVASGRVVDLQGRPIAGAEVLLLPASTPKEGSETALRETLRASTDVAGRFRIERLRQGTFDLQTRARGFVPTRIPRLAIAQGTESVDLGVVALERGAVLEGRVVDTEGNPVERAAVQVQPASGLRPGDIPSDGQRSDWEAVTGGDGGFSLTGFQNGEVLTLRATRQGFSAQTLSRIAVPVEEPLLVVLTPAARIAGRVVDESGNPVSGAQLVLLEDREEETGPNRTGRFRGGAESGSEGRFVLEDVAPGRFRLVAVHAGFRPTTHGGLSLAEASSIEDLEIVLHRGATIEGRISAPDGSPVANARVMVLVKETETSLGLVGRPEAFADAEGRYELSGVADGDREILAEHSGFRPTRGRIRVQEGANRLDLRLDRGFEVSGRVSDLEGPIPGASVRLLPHQENPETPPQTLTRPDGAFRFLALAAGRYHIQVEKPGYSMASPAEEVWVTGASIENLEIRLEHGSAVAGRIRGLGFQDLAQVQVVATAAGQPGQMGSVDYEGRYRIEGLSSGEWKILASLPSSNKQTGGLIVLDSGQAEATLDLEFAAGFVLSGRVERDGVPIGGALILLEAADGSGGNTVTGPDGRFRIEDLHSGTYAMTALAPRDNLRRDQRLEIEGDREILVTLPDLPKTGASQP